MTRISEPQLILPALYIISRQPGITTSDLIMELRSIFNPTGEDAEILKGRADDKFSQIVRNLVSHHTLDQRLRYTTIEDIDATNSHHTITEEGNRYLLDNIQAFEGLLSDNLDYAVTVEGIEQINKSQVDGKKILAYDENLLITEGKKKTVTAQVYERSRLLRERAIEAYTHSGRIICAACGFDFLTTYGEIGRGYIEIHHQKPIFQYEDTDFTRFVSDAIKDLLPLCSNCHRILHRRKENILTVQELKDLVNREQT